LRAIALAVARYGTTIQAAKALGINQSTVQRRIAALERQLGRRLFERRPEGHRLTRLDEELRPIAERVEIGITDFTQHSASSDVELMGTIRVTCPETAAYRIMKSPILDAFHARYPRLRVEMVMVDRVLDLAKGARWLKRVAPHARIAASCTTTPALVLAVESGAGISPLPVIAVENETDVVCLFDAIPELRLPFYLLIHRDMQRTPRVRAFCDFVASEMKTFRELLVGRTDRR
jgi:DNA-binding transcriptional LysR family regulator